MSKDSDMIAYLDGTWIIGFADVTFNKFNLGLAIGNIFGVKFSGQRTPRLWKFVWWGV